MLLKQPIAGSSLGWGNQNSRRLFGETNLAPRRFHWANLGFFNIWRQTHFYAVPKVGPTSPMYMSWHDKPEHPSNIQQWYKQLIPFHSIPFSPWGDGFPHREVASVRGPNGAMDSGPLAMRPLFTQLVASGLYLCDLTIRSELIAA